MQHRERLTPHFESAFGGARLTHIVRAPGRVNLIGEHTDYNGLSVFPMAIQREVRLVLRARADEKVRLVNVDPRFGEREFELAERIQPFAQGDWGNYAKAAAQILVERVEIERGFEAVVEGDIPDAAGLSSSSALVVACALGLLAASEIDMAREELAELCARGERYVGTHSGGMDQAICLGGKRGHALVIDFNPVRMQPVRVPDDWCFVIANSLVKAEKSGVAREAYNTRTRECREALERFFSHPRSRSLPSTYFELVEHVPTARLLEAARDSLDGVLLKRFRHVVSEGARVRSAQEAMLRADAHEFGRLMDASHASLRDDYDVSCAELDELVTIALEAGAFGARLTGAGFGGCIVALCSTSTVDSVVDTLRLRYHRYYDRPESDALIVVEGTDGASVEKTV